MATGLTAGSAGLHRVTLETPIGRLTLVCSARGVVATIVDEPPENEGQALGRIAGSFADRDRGGRSRAREAARATARTAGREAARYFGGRLTTFSVPPDLTLVAAGFGRRVLEVVATIPHGELWTYGDVAGMAGSPRAARAAGSALASCPIELFVPCHRVVHAEGAIRGYGRHDDRKRWLLRHEGAIA